MSFFAQPWLLKQPLAAPSLGLNFLATTLDPRITFTRAAGSASYFDGAGAVQAAGTNVARFDYDPVTHASRGLMIEEARTNLLLNSATLSTQSVTVTAAATTLSFYGTGTVTLSGTFAGSLVGAGAFPARASLTFTPTAGSLTCTVTGSVLNAQVETGGFVTSWIPTTGASATRADDVAQITTLGAWFNPLAGTLVVDAMLGALGTAGVSFGVLLSVNDGTLNNSIVLANSPNGNALAATTKLGSGTNLPTQFVAAGVAYKTAVAWSVAGFYEALNGIVQGPTAAGVPTVSTLGIGNQAGGASIRGACWIRRARVFTRALSVPELKTVST